MPDAPETPEKPELKPAAANPWYVLMTVAGEQTGEGVWTDIGRDLHARNRRLWNGWAAQALSAKEKAKLVENGRATEDDIAPLTKAETAAIDRALAERCPDAEKPDPENGPRFREAEVEAVFCARGFLFPRYADFGVATFSSYADFEGANFSNDAHFRNAIFLRPADFNGTNFSQSADFLKTTFSTWTSFRMATFSGFADFRSTTFSDDAIFERATFSGLAVFGSATFSREVQFDDAKLEAATYFSPFRIAPEPQRVRFLRNPPTFFGATLHEDTDFTDVEWPPVPDDEDPERRRDRAIQHRRRYERLKLLMDSQKKVADELMFQRLELRCREAEASGDWRQRDWWVARISRLYGVLSDYGWDPVRPALWLAGLILTGWVLIGIAEWWDYNLGTWPDPGRPPETLGPGQAFAVSLSNVFGFLGVGRTFLREEILTLTTVSEVVSVVQTVAGLILVFLLGLTLRNRFRIK